MKIINGTIKRLNFLFLDLVSIPGFFVTKKWNALYHLKIICPACPEYRRKLRDVNKKGECWWLSEWQKEDYGIPRHFGIKNFINQYLFLKTDLSKFKKIK